MKINNIFATVTPNQNWKRMFGAELARWPAVANFFVSQLARALVLIRPFV